MNLRPVLVFYARLVAFVLLVECVTFWGWSRWFWTPVQAHYMGAYVWSSMRRKAPDSDLRIRWIWKTALGGKRELAIEDDAIRLSYTEQDKTGMGLSQSAREAGWMSLVEGVPERVPATKLRSILADQIFEGQSVWVFVLLPGMIGFAAAIFLLQCLIWLEDWLPEMPWRRQRFPWEVPPPAILDQCAIWVGKISLLVRWGGAAIQRTGVRQSVTTMNLPEKQAPEEPRSFALSVFGFQDGSSERVYLWSERDEIE